MVLDRAGSALALAVLLVACAPERPGAGLPPVPVPARLEQVDAPVRAQYDERRTTLDRLLEERAPAAAELAAAYGRLGMWHHAYEDTELAELCYRHAHELDPDAPPWIYYLAQVRAGLGRVEAARRGYARFLELRPNDPAGLVRLAEFEAGAGAAAAARPLFRGRSRRRCEERAGARRPRTDRARGT